MSERMGRRFLIFVLAVLCGAAVLVAVGSATGAGSGTGRIVFSSTLPTYPLPEGFDLSRIYSVGLDGQRSDLSANAGPLSDETASVSSDRSRIAFKRGEAWWLMKADGSRQRLLLAPGSGQSLGDSAIWSPDGTKLAIEDWSHCRVPPGYLCSDQGGSVIVDVTGNRVGQAGLNPAWSPDSRWIASDWASGTGDATEVDYHLGLSAPAGASVRWIRARVQRDDCLGLASWSPDGRWLRALTTGCEANTGVNPRTLFVVRVAHGSQIGKALALGEGYVSWSPDGSRRAFSRGRGLFLGRGDGSHAHPLARHDGRVAWSPNGKRLAFISWHALFVARADGRQAHLVATNAGALLWSAGGRSLAFTVGSRLFVARADGTRVRALAAHVGCPQWSPDGRSLAFQSATSGQIAVVSASGGPAQTLSHELAGSLLQLLAWSQDSTHLLYTSKLVPTGHGIWTVNPDGTGLEHVISGEDLSPTWSPDAQRIAFERHAAQHSAIYTIRPNGSGLKLLIGGPHEQDLNPAWSPDGHQIVFLRSTEEYHTDLFLINTDGTGLRRLTRDGRAEAPAWSPDGSEIAYADQYDDGIDLIHPDGTGKRRLIGQNAEAPAWSPDGSQIAYLQGTAGRVLSLINADGTDPHLILSANSLLSAPSWSPDGKTIVYASDGISTNAGHLYTIDTASHHRTDLTPFPLPIDSRDPTWSHG